LSDTWARRSARSLAALSERVGDGPTDPPDVPPARVLVADDNAVNQKVAVHILESLGLRTDVAANGREALEMLRLMDYDVVLMDCKMPVMGGPEAVAEMRRREGSGRHTPVISMTAGEPEDCPHLCLECGMDDVLQKPIRAQSITEALQRWIPLADGQIVRHHQQS
jgi:two-component system sensor histidine kinase/response regulator